MAQDYGCLPGQFEIVKKFDEEGKIWACHSKPDKICKGLVNARSVTGSPNVGEKFGTW
jgi:hypothetical protein